MRERLTRIENRVLETSKEQIARAGESTGLRDRLARLEARLSDLSREQVAEVFDAPEEEAVEHIADSTDAFHEPEMPRARAQTTGHALRLFAFGFLAAAVVAAAVSFLFPSSHPVRELVTGLGLSPAVLAGLGLLLLVGGAMLGRIAAIHDRAEHEIQGIDEVAQRIHSVFQGLQGFQDRLEQLRADLLDVVVDPVVLRDRVARTPETIGDELPARIRRARLRLRHRQHGDVEADELPLHPVNCSPSFPVAPGLALG